MAKSTTTQGWAKHIGIVIQSRCYAVCLVYVQYLASRLWLDCATELCIVGPKPVSFGYRNTLILDFQIWADERCHSEWDNMSLISFSAIMTRTHHSQTISPVHTLHFHTTECWKQMQSLDIFSSERYGEYILVTSAIQGSQEKWSNDDSRIAMKGILEVLISTI
jgi:hypothetical protein